MFDSNSSGLVDAAEFEAVLHKIGLAGADAASVQSVFASLDPNGRGTMDYAEFAGHLLGWKSSIDSTYGLPAGASTDDDLSLEDLSATEAAAKVWARMVAYARSHGRLGTLQLFRRFDADSSGAIDLAEFSAALEAIGFVGVPVEVAEKVRADTTCARPFLIITNTRIYPHFNHIASRFASFNVI